MSGEQRPGDWRVICQMSGFKGWASDCVKTWDGFYVLKRFAGSEVNRHPQEFVRGRPDNQAVPWTSPEPADVFLSPGDVLPSDL